MACTRTQSRTHCSQLVQLPLLVMGHGGAGAILLVAVRAHTHTVADIEFQLLTGSDWDD